jgi:hypothetical protein
MSVHRISSFAAFALFALGAARAVAGCDTETATSSLVENGYAQVDGGVGPTVYRAWWLATYYPDPVAPGGTSATQRSVPGSDFAYAVMAPDWEPASQAPPERFVVLRSKAKIEASRGDTLAIVVDDAHFDGNCEGGKLLSQDDADFITQRIFPGEFAGKTYEAQTCTLRNASDGGDAGDAGRD